MEESDEIASTLLLTVATKNFLPVWVILDDVEVEVAIAIPFQEVTLEPKAYVLLQKGLEN